MQEQKTEQKIKVTLWARTKVKINNFFSKFDIKKAHFESLPLIQQKVINIAALCIENKDSKLYFNNKTGSIQIELPKIFITITQAHGFYEVDVVYIGQDVPTSDKVIFDSSGIVHIYDKFDKEVENRMKENVTKKDDVVTNHLDGIYKIVETF